MSQTPRQAPIIIPDSRGRVQLPKKYRNHKLFEIIEQGGSLVLHPLKAQRLDLRSEAKTEKLAWTRVEVLKFLKKELKLKLAKLMDPDIITIILYGSQARGDSRQNSDIDLAV